MPRAEIIAGADARCAAASDVISFSQWRAPLRSPAAPDAEPDGGEDAALIRFCRRHELIAEAVDRFDRAVLSRVWKPGDTNQAELDLLLDDSEHYLDQIIGSRATTIAGIRAKGAALVRELEAKVRIELDAGFEEQACDYELWAMSLARDAAVIDLSEISDV